MKFFVIFLCLVFVLSGQVVVGDEPTCNELKQDMDDMVKKIFLISNPNIRPFKSPQDFKKKYCDPFLSKSDGGWVKIMSRYRRCKRSFQRTVYGILLKNFKEHGQRLCDREEDRALATKHYKCLGPEAYKAFINVSNHITILVEHVTDRPNINEMIPALCCGAHISLDMIEKEIDKTCNRKTGLQTGKFIKEVVSYAITEILDFLCGQYNRRHVCFEKVPKIVQEVNTTLYRNDPIYSHTPAWSFLRFIERMDSELNLND